MLRLRGVTVRYDRGAHAALDDVSLEIPEGSVTALIGPSGCGKSTLLRLFVALVGPTSGAVEVDDQPVPPPGDERIRRLRRRFGYVIQEGGLFPHLTARANATLQSRKLGLGSADPDARLDELCELCHFDRGLLARYPGELSGGQRQRLAIVRALMHDPEFLLLDEPLGALDPVVRAGLQDELRALFARLAKTVVMVTHDLAEAAFFSEDIVLLRRGRIAQRGPFAAMRESPADEFVEGFLEAQSAREVPS